MMPSLQTGTEVPKYVLAERAILESIRTGEYAPGDRLPSERDLASELGIAPMTLRQGILRLVDEGVLERRQRVGTFVSRTPRHRNIALLVFHVPRIEPGMLPDAALDALRGAALAQNRQVRALLMFDPYPPPAEFLAELRAMNVGAAGLLGFYNSDYAFISGLAHVLPCVLFNKSLPGLALPTAMPDVGMAARLMIDYFSGRNRRRIAVGTIITGNQMNAGLSFAIQSELRRHGLPVDKRFWREIPAPDLGREMEFAWVDRMVEMKDGPDALIVNGTDVADHAERRLAESGKEIGRDMDVIPWHGIPNAAELRRNFPILELGNFEAARAATGLLLQAMEADADREAAPVIMTEPRLVMPNGDDSSREDMEE